MLKSHPIQSGIKNNPSRSVELGIDELSTGLRDAAVFSTEGDIQVELADSRVGEGPLIGGGGGRGG